MSHLTNTNTDLEDINIDQSTAGLEDNILATTDLEASNIANKEEAATTPTPQSDKKKTPKRDKKQGHKVDDDIHIERQVPEDLPSLIQKIQEYSAGDVEGENKLVDLYHDMIYKVFKASPYGVYCFTCHQPLQPNPTLKVTAEMLRNHCNRVHNKINIILPHKFYSDMASKFNHDIQSLQKVDFKKTALMKDNEQYISEQKFYCNYCNIIMSDASKHNCAGGTVKKCKCYRSWCKRWVRHWDYIWIDPSLRFDGSDKYNEILQGRKKDMDKFKIKDDPNDTRPLFTIFYLNSYFHLSNNDTMTIKKYVIENSEKLHFLSEELVKQPDRRHIPKIEENLNPKSTFYQLYQVIQSCPIVKEAIQHMTSLGLYKDGYHTSFSLLWNESGNKAQNDFHLDYDAVTQQVPGRAISRSRTAARSATVQPCSLMIALDTFALDCVLNYVVKRIDVVEGAAIAFTNKLYHRGASNPGPAGWRLFMYSSPDPLPGLQKIHGRVPDSPQTEEDSCYDDDDDDDEVKKPASKKQKKK